ncbi:MAG: HAD family hydrolase [Candidatus Omnitrophica bacterium]|nr:HAD family hydrolase [Candidatus Omnitrophota bacterium]
MRAVFLDRDGVINRYPGDRRYVTSWKSFRFLPRAKAALKHLQEEGFKLFIVSNQAGVSKGLYTRGTLMRITKNMLGELKASGVTLSGVYYCTHRHEENCSCRKPKPGLIRRAVKALAHKGLKLRRSQSYFIGDSMTDVQTGKSAGLKTVLVFSGKEKPVNRQGWNLRPDYAVADLSAAARSITQIKK